MMYLEKMRALAADSSKCETKRFLGLFELYREIRTRALDEEYSPELPRTVTKKELKVAWLIRSLGFIYGKYGNRKPVEKWSADCPSFLAGILEFIDSPEETYFDKNLPLVDRAREAMDNRRNELQVEGYFSVAEVYDWNTSEGNDGY